MEVKIVTYKQTVLKLDDVEVAWLRGILQNPIGQTESPSDSKMRKVFFEALTIKGAA